MMEIGRLGQSDGACEFRDPSRSLIIRGTHPEWVLQAAAEIIGDFSRLEGESLVAELTALLPLGAADPAELAAARADQRERFATSPRCSVSFGIVNYLWAASEGPGLKPDELTVRPLTLAPDMLVAHPDDRPRLPASAG
jgi:hypothetical protein